MNGFSVSRRFFLSAVLQGLFLVSVKGYATADDSRFPFLAASESGTDPLFSDPALISHIGRLYLAEQPGEACIDDLKRLLSMQGKPNTAYGLYLTTAAPDARGKTMAGDRLRDIVVIDGCVLSRAEARLCALLLLTHTV